MFSILRRLFGGPPRKPASDRLDGVLAEMKAGGRPCLRVVAGGDGRSRLGGVPDMSGPWPRYAGRALCCVAQLDLADMRAAGGPDWLPQDGRLLFFYELEHGGWGFDSKDAGSSVVIHDAGAPTAAEEPADLTDEARFPAYPVRFVHHISRPVAGRLAIDPERLSAAEARALETDIESAAPEHQVGGYPGPIQSDTMEIKCETVTRHLHRRGGTAKARTGGAADWRLLLQLDTDDDAGMMWGDVGRLYFWIREQDARAGDFSRTWTILQCH